MYINEIFYCSKCMRQMDDEGVCPFCGYNSDGEVDWKTLEEGTLLQNGRYQLGAVLGAGGFGITYAAWDLTLEQSVAIKEFFPEAICRRDVRESDEVLVSDEDYQSYQIGLLRFNREARILVTLQNIKSVVAAYDWFEDNGTAYIVMEFVRGKNLDQYVRDENIDSTKLFELMRDLVDSLVSIHEQGVLHRDISPSNILVQEDGTVKLIDFGAATIEERRLEGKDRTVMFNRQFAPIEQYDETGRQGPWTDVYALSATLYYVITGEFPQEAMSRKGHDTLQSVKTENGRLKKWQEKAIMDGMIISPEKRIQNMAIFRSILYHLPMPEEIKKRRAFIIKVGAAAAAVVAVMAVVMANATFGLSLGKGMRYGLRRDGFHILNYNGKNETLTIPDKLLGISVVEIEDNAFSSASDIKEVEIPGSVTNIGARAFSGCNNLESVVINEGNQSIGEYAFSDCPVLNTVVIPESTKNFSAGVFYGSGLNLTVWCEDGTESQRVLAGEEIHTASLSDYETEENESGITITGYHGVISDIESREVFVMPDYIDGKAVTEIQTSADSLLFGDTYTDITLSSHLKNLPTGIVNGLTDLESLEMGPDLTELGEKALFNCGIHQLTLPDTLATIGESAFSQSFIESIEFLDSVTEVGDSVFASCIRLESIVLSGGMTEVPDGAFEGCTALETVTFSENKNMKRIGVLAFSKCRSLETIRLPGGLETIEPYAFSECVKLQIIYIPPSVTKIANTAFDGCPADMVIAGISDTMSEAFADAYGFEFLAMDQWDWSAYGVTDSGGLIVWDGAEEEDITYLPSMYTNYSNNNCYAVNKLEEATSLKSSVVYLPRYIDTIWGLALAGNEYVTEVYGYDKLTKIELMAFWKCKNLKSMHFNSNVDEIAAYAFAEDEKLTEIVLPESLQYIGGYVFWKCSNLENINIPSSLTLLSDGCFSETGIHTLTVPGNVVKCRTAFYGCRNLKEVILEEGVKTLMGTFAECSNLETIVIPSSMEQITRSTFRGCTSLTDVWIYSDDVNLDSIWSSLQHVKELDVVDGDIVYYRERLEAGASETPLLFADCPNVTLHGHRGSSAQIYAMEHGLKFEIIE